MKKTWIRALCAVLCLILLATATLGCANVTMTSGKNTDPSGEDAATTDGGATNTEASEGELDAALVYYADIAIRGYGVITVRLAPDAAPITVANFVRLAESGFYDGLTFHRIIEGFMMQGGAPNGNGTGGSGTNIVGEFAVNGYNNSLIHTRGTISMARAKNYDSASSQFFIVHQDYPSLAGKYAAFGHVTEGIEIVDAICEAAEPIDSNGLIARQAQPVITSITIRTEQNQG